MLMFRPLLRYADFGGRARRAEYWGFMLLQFGVYLLCCFMIAASLGSARETPAGAFMGALFWLGMIGLIMAGLALPNYAVLARRLHDTGRSAIWMALILPGIAAQVTTVGSAMKVARMAAAGETAGVDATSAVMAAASGSAVISLIAMACNIALFVLTLLPGMVGPNRFGPDPRNPDAAAPAAPQGGLTGYDEARLEELFAQAKRDRGDPAATAEPYRPVFDFSPGASGPMRTDIPATAWNPRPLEAAAGDATGEVPVRDATPPRPSHAGAFPGTPRPEPAAGPIPPAAPFPGQSFADPSYAGAAPTPRPFGRRGA